MQRFPLLPLAAAAAITLSLAACADDTRPTGPGARPSLDISDGAHAGNADFFFLPPMVADPSSDPAYEAGEFNARLAPAIEICELASGSCGTVVRTFAAGTVALSTTDEHYHANWDTKGPEVVADRIYRITVLLGDSAIGHADVQVLSSGSQLKNVQTDEYVGLVDGRTLPIKFRIEHGVLCGSGTDCTEQAVTSAGGTFVTDSGFAGVRFPSGWLPSPYEDSTVTLAIHRVTVGPDNRCHPYGALTQFEGCYSFETYPDVGRFALPAVAGVCLEPDGEASPLRSYLQLHASDPGEPLRALPSRDAPFITCEGFAGSSTDVSDAGLLDRAGDRLWGYAARVGRWVQPRAAYAVDLGRGGEIDAFSFVGYAVPLFLEKAAGDGQTAAVGTTIPVTVRVMMKPHHDDQAAAPAPDVAVAFAVVSGDGSVSALLDTTDAAGEVTVQWTLGALVGTQALRASVDGADPDTTSFTATATEPQPTSPVIFAETFEDNAIGSTPTTPDVGDSWQTHGFVSGDTVAVRSELPGVAFSPAIHLAQVARAAGSLGFRGDVAGTAPTTGTYRVRWASFAHSPTICFAPIVLRGSNGGIVASVEYRPSATGAQGSGNLTYNSATTVVGTWTQNKWDSAEIYVNLDAKTTTLYLNGSTTPALQDVPFYQATTGAPTDLASVAVEFGCTSAQSLVWDDVTIERVDVLR